MSVSPREVVAATPKPDPVEQSLCVVEGRLYPVDGVVLANIDDVGLVHLARDPHTILGDRVRPALLTVVVTIDAQPDAGAEIRA